MQMQLARNVVKKKLQPRFRVEAYISSPILYAE